MNKVLTKIRTRGLVLITIIVLCIGLSSCGNDSVSEKEELLLAGLLPELNTENIDIVSNTDTYMEFYVLAYTEKNYITYKDACKDDGYVCVPIEEDYSYEAYNDDGYKVSLLYETDSHDMLVKLETPMQMEAGVFTDLIVSDYLPEPSSNLYNVMENSKEKLEIYIGATDEEEYGKYIEACKNIGYKKDIIVEDRKFIAKNNKNYTLNIEYIDYQIMKVSLTIPYYSVNIEAVCAENLVMNKYDVELYLGDELQGTIIHGSSETFNLELKEDTYTVNVCEVSNSDIKGHAEFKVKSDENIKCELVCKSDKISVKVVKGVNPPYENKELGTKKRKDVVADFKEAGFKNIEVVAVNELNKEELSSKLGIVKDITIDGDEEYSKEKKYYTDSKVIIKYSSGKKIPAPIGERQAKEMKYKTVMTKFKDAGFTNVIAVKAKKPYNSSAQNGNVSEIIIGGDDSVYEGDEYVLNDKVVVKYYSITYTHYYMSELIDDIDSNVMRAQDKYEDKYVKITGRVDTIRTGGSFDLAPTNDSWEIRLMTCTLQSDKQKDTVKKMSKGDIVTVYGRIYGINNYGGMMTVHSIDR